MKKGCPTLGETRRLTQNEHRLFKLTNIETNFCMMKNEETDEGRTHIEFFRVRKGQHECFLLPSERRRMQAKLEHFWSE